MDSGATSTLADRLWGNVRKTASGCWEYGKPGRYGTVGRLSAHRLAYQLARGPVPVGLLVCHHCDNPPCVNPEHLYAGTHSDNTRDAYARNRYAASRARYMAAVMPERIALVERAVAWLAEVRRPVGLAELLAALGIHRFTTQAVDAGARYHRWAQLWPPSRRLIRSDARVICRGSGHRSTYQFNDQAGVATEAA